MVNEEPTPNTRKLCASKQFFFLPIASRFNMKSIVLRAVNLNSILIRWGSCKLTHSTISISWKAERRRTKYNKFNGCYVRSLQVDFCYWRTKSLWQSKWWSNKRIEPLVLISGFRNNRIFSEFFFSLLLFAGHYITATMYLIRNHNYVIRSRCILLQLSCFRPKSRNNSHRLDSGRLKHA